jgi:hypothetical protein
MSEVKPLPIPKQMTEERIEEILNEYGFPKTSTLYNVAWKVWAGTREYFHRRLYILDKYVTHLENENKELREMVKHFELGPPIAQPAEMPKASVE